MKLKKIYIINGTGKSGKDFFVSTIKEYLEEEYKMKVVNYSTIDEIKKVAIESFGWDRKKDAKGRKLLHELKKAHTEYSDNLKQKTLKVMQDFLSSDEDVLFIHCREIEEIKDYINMNYVLKQYIRNNVVVNLSFDSIETILIDRVIKVWGNDSDDNVSNYSYTHKIINNGCIAGFIYKAVDFARKQILELEEGK